MVPIFIFHQIPRTEISNLSSRRIGIKITHKYNLNTVTFRVLAASLLNFHLTIFNKSVKRVICKMGTVVLACRNWIKQ